MKTAENSIRKCQVHMKLKPVRVKMPEGRVMARVAPPGSTREVVASEFEVVDCSLCCEPTIPATHPSCLNSHVLPLSARCRLPFVRLWAGNLSLILEYEVLTCTNIIESTLIQSSLSACKHAAHVRWLSLAEAVKLRLQPLYRMAAQLGPVLN